MTDLVKSSSIDPSEMMVPASGKQQPTTAITPTKKGRGKKVKEQDSPTPLDVRATQEAQGLGPSGNALADGSVALVQGMGHQARVAATHAMGQEAVKTIEHIGAMGNQMGDALLALAQQQFGVTLEDGDEQ